MFVVLFKEFFCIYNCLISTIIFVFGGFLIGLGIGLVIKAGGVIDGLEIIADYSNKKWGFTTSEIILLIIGISQTP